MKYLEKYWTIFIVVFFFSMFMKPAICVLIVGALVFYIGLNAILFLRKIKEKGVVGIGRILSYKVDDEGYKIPVIEFTPLGRETVAAKPSFYVSTDLSKIWSYSKMTDREVRILYDPDDPTKFLLLDEKSFSHIGSVICIVAGLFFIVLSVRIFLGHPI